MDVVAPPSKRAEFWAGVRATIPLVVGAIPFGIVFGAVAVSNGLSPLGTAAMSLLVFAGSAQFIAAGLVGEGAGLLVIVFTTLIINLRHLLYAISLSPFMRHLPQRWLAPLSFWLTDESYLVAFNHYTQPQTQSQTQPHPTTNKHWFYFGSAIFLYSCWQILTMIGIIAGQSIPDPRRWGLHFALIVVFIGMLTPLLRERAMLLCVLAAGGSALLFRHLPNQLGLFLAVLVGVGCGLLIERGSRERASREHAPHG